MKKLLPLFAIAALPFLGSCKDTLHGGSVASAQSKVFHASYDAGDFTAIYDSAATEFKAVTTKEDFVKLMANVQAKLGKIKSSNQRSFNTNTLNGVTKTVLVDHTEFEQGSATETLTYIINGETASLLAYHIESPKLLAP